MLIADGCSVKAVQRYMGHVAAAETLDTYGHLWPDEDKIKAAIDRALRNSEESLRNRTAPTGRESHITPARRARATVR